MLIFLSFYELEFDDNWRQIEKFHLKIEKWCQEEHLIQSLLKGIVADFFLNNLPRAYRKRSYFEAIGHFGGLINISS